MQTTSVSLTSPYTWLPLAALATLLLSLGHRRAPQIIITVATLELLIVAATTTPTVPWSTILKPPSLIQSLPDDVQNKQSRILTLARGGDSGLWLTNPGTRPDAAKRQQRHELLVPANHALFNIAGTQWPASLDLQAHGQVLEPLTQNGSSITDVKLAEEFNLGAIILDPSIEVGPAADVMQLPHATILDLNPAPRAALLTEQSTIPLPYEPITPTKLSWTLNATSTSTLIVRDTLYPGWQAMIDAEPTPITAYQTIFRQITVPPGPHTITMIFKPQTLQWGLIISLLACVLLVAAALSTIRGSGRPYRPLSTGR